MLKIDLHTHTIASGHGFNTMYELAAEAKRRKMKMIAITDHGPGLGSVPPRNYFQLAYRIPKRIYGARVLFGVELNVMDEAGNIDLEEKILDLLKPILLGQHKTYGLKDSGEKINTIAMVNAMKNPYVQIISHPVQTQHPVEIEKVALAACKYGKLLELNCSAFKYMKKITRDELSQIRTMIEIVKNQGQKLIVNSDAHIASDLGDDTALMKMQKELGFSSKDIINNYPEELFSYLKIDG